MIKRIVKMTFREEEVINFFELFESKKQAIRTYPGCLYLEVFQDKHQPNIVFTYSFWTEEAALNDYRHSDLFKATWKATKVLFAEKPEAHSLVVYDIVRPDAIG